MSKIDLRRMTREFVSSTSRRSSNTLNEVRIGSFEVTVKDGGIQIGDGFYKIQASTWLGTFDVAIDNITGTEAEGITVAGKAAGKTVSQLLPAGKIAEIKANVMKKIAKFKVEGKLADFIFLKK